MKKISLNEEKIRKMYFEELMTMDQIAERVGTSRYPVSIIVRKYGKTRTTKSCRDVKKYIKERIKIDDNGCWNYPYGILSSGYARLCNKRAHRVSYEAFKGKIPDGLTIDHLCRNRMCINPDHLEVVTVRENIMRGNTLAAINKRKTHCRRGHPYSKENTRMTNGERVCKICASINSRNYYLRKREK